MATMMSAIGEATGMKPDDSVIGLGALTGAKMKAMTYCAALVESISPELRHLLTTHMNEALAEQERMAQMAVSKGWYKATAGADDLVQQAVEQAKPVLQA